MQVQTAGRTERVKSGIVSEARLSETDDEFLVEEAVNGSSAAFGVLFERYERRVFYLARRMLRNREDAEDAAQAAFERAYVHLKSFQGQSRFSTWLTRIAINEALMQLRKRRPGHVSIEANKIAEDKNIALEIEDTAATPEEQCEAQELQGILSASIGELKPLLVEVVQLREIQELSAEETAAVLGLPRGTVKARTFRARRLLRQKLAQRLGIARSKTVGSLYLESGTGGRNRRHDGLSTRFEQGAAKAWRASSLAIPRT